MTRHAACFPAARKSFGLHRAKLGVQNAVLPIDMLVAIEAIPHAKQRHQNLSAASGSSRHHARDSSGIDVYPQKVPVPSGTAGTRQPIESLGLGGRPCSCSEHTRHFSVMCSRKHPYWRHSLTPCAPHPAHTYPASSWYDSLFISHQHFLARPPALNGGGKLALVL